MKLRRICDVRPPHGQRLNLLLNILQPASGTRMRREKLRSAGATISFQLFEEARHFDWLIAGSSHDSDAQSIRLCFGLTGVPQQDRVDAQTEAKLTQLRQ
jgi:hypothetical protein